MTSLHSSMATPTVTSLPFTIAEASETASDASPDTSDQDILTAAQSLLLHFTHRHRQPWHLWAPRLAALMLMRSGEIGRLETGDLTSIDCRWFLHIQRGPTGPLAAPRRRVIPVPQALVDAGFVEFVRQLPPGRLFPELLSKKPEGSIESWVRVEARRHDDPSLHAWNFAGLRRAGATVLEMLPGGLYASAAMRGVLVTARLPEEVERYEVLRDPLELAWFVDRVAFPDIGGPVVPRAWKLRLKGQRVVRMAAAP